jgi:hypothetical protein
MTKRVLIFLGFFLAAAWVWFSYSATQDPAVQQRLIEGARTLPDLLVYPLYAAVVLVMFILVWLIFFLLPRWTKNASQAAALEAHRIAQMIGWEVTGGPIVQGKWVGVRFQHNYFTRRGFFLPVPPGHPDVEQFRQLKKGNEVRFEALSEPLESALEFELCGFLRIKSVT